MHLPTWDMPIFKCSSSDITHPNTKATSVWWWLRAI